MLRLSPPGFLRFGQSKSLDMTFGGGEANVAVSLANFGMETDFVTRLPENDWGNACIAWLKGFGVGTGKILRGGSRMGLYFLENGAAQRGSKVLYDRDGSSIAAIEKGMVDWDRVFEDADWFHWTGITPAISAGLCEVCLEGILKAREKGLTVSCDLNYRAKLWKWGKKAAEVMPELVRHCDIAIGNEEDADRVFGIQAPGTDVAAGRVEAEKFRFVAEGLTEKISGPEARRDHLAGQHQRKSQYLVGDSLRRQSSLPRSPVRYYRHRRPRGLRRCLCRRPDLRVADLRQGSAESARFCGSGIVPEAFRRRRCQPGERRGSGGAPVRGCFRPSVTLTGKE